MPAIAAPPIQSPRCPSCGKQWQGIRSAGGLGPLMFQHHCENRDCRKWFALFYRVSVGASGVRTQLLGITRMLGRDLGSLSDTMDRTPGLTSDEKELLLVIAQQLGRLSHAA